VALFDSGVFNRLEFLCLEGLDLWIVFLEAFDGVASAFAACDTLLGLLIELDPDRIRHASATETVFLNRQGRDPSFYPNPNRSSTRL
jgi:hypothetical protein